MTMRYAVTRRDFLKRAAVFSSIGVAPQFLTELAAGEAPVIERAREGRILVVVQLSGGNDGLNTLVPYSDDAYYRARPRLGLKQERLLPLDGDLALNNRLAPLKNLYDNGELAIVQGVGYPNPDRSHFRSMEIWHTASGSDEYLGTGWIGRYFDNTCSGSDAPHVGMSVGKERPQAFQGAKGFGIACENPARFGWIAGKGADTAENFERINNPRESGGGTLDFLRHTTANAIMSAKEVRAAAEQSRFEGDPARQPLAAVAALIRAELPTRVYYVSAGGFDTHANQLGQHDNLLERVANELSGFQQTLKRDGNADRVLTVVFSEFGRRVAENGSGGTDHGTAAPMFLVGAAVKPGLHGQAPSLSDLDGGDLKHTVDFRSVYATVIEAWLEADSKAVLGRAFDRVPVLA